MLSACASTGFDKKASKVDWNNGGIVAMSVGMTNEYRPSFGPTSLGVRMQYSKGSTSSVVESAGEGRTNVLLTKQLAPGSYTITSLTGASNKFPILANFEFTVEAPFEVPAGSVVYLGHLELTNKALSDPDDQATGFATPLIDQAVAGFSGGTLKVELQDQFEQDAAKLRQEYPALRTANIVRAPLGKMLLNRRMGSTAPKVVVTANAPVAGLSEKNPSPLTVTKAEGAEANSQNLR